VRGAGAEAVIRMAEQAPPAARRWAWWSLLFVAAIAALLYVGLPKIAGLHDTWGRLSSGDPSWLIAAVLFEVASYAAYVLAFHRLFARPGSPIGWSESYDVSLAGVAATRLFALAGAGGIALTAWALGRSGMSPRERLSALTTFYVAIYAIFMAALVVVGIGLRIGLFAGEAPFGLTVVPAIFGGLVIVFGLLAARVPRDLGERVGVRAEERRRAAALRRLAGWAAAVAVGVRGAIGLLRNRDTALLGALGWWAFDIAVLWACFHAFGDAPPTSVVVMGYFTGMLGNLLPFPGGLGGVEAGMIGAFIGFGVAGGLAVAAVLTYRAFSYWLPLLPGVVSYLRLLRTVRTW
jgi:putative heme transporter